MVEKVFSNVNCHKNGRCCASVLQVTYVKVTWSYMSDSTPRTERSSVISAGDVSTRQVGSVTFLNLLFCWGLFYQGGGVRGIVSAVIFLLYVDAVKSFVLLLSSC